MNTITLFLGLMGLASGQMPSETLVYDILVEGVRSGSMTRTVSLFPNNDVQYETKANTTVRFLFLNFRYQFKGSEVWNNDKVISLQGECIDDGTKHQVRLNASTLIHNRHETELAVSPWTTGGCHPPPGEGTYLTLDPDTGVLRKTRFSKGSQDTFVLAGESKRGTLWETDLPGNVRFLFDDNGKLLRQSWKEQGRHVEIRLCSTRAN